MIGTTKKQKLSVSHFSFSFCILSFEFSMSNRHLGRTIAMQALYEWDFGGQRSETGGLITHTMKDFAPKFDDKGFVHELVDGVAGHLRDIDALIAKYAPEWPIEKITLVDRNVLRLGVYELVFVEAIPSKVAINEAIELAKTFGGEMSGKFVNGVLGAIYRDRKEAGKLKKIDEEESSKT